MKHLNLTIQEGEFLGLLGPNGAGKTTTIRLLCTLLIPTEGEIRVDGMHLNRRASELKRRFSVMTQEYSLRNDMNLLEIMELQGRLYGLKRSESTVRAQELLTFCSLWDYKEKTVRKLSGGMKRKLMLCRALLTDPDYLLLDEPTVGLDPVSRRQMWELLRRLNRNGLTILLTTHYIEEAQSLCGRVALLDHGCLDAVDTPSHLIAQLGVAAVDRWEENEMKSHFFQKRDSALAYAESLPGKLVVRDTTLEDVFLVRTGYRCGPPPSGMGTGKWES